jgi:hypothetical protein
LDTWHIPKNIPGDDAVRNGRAISALMEICRIWPVENAIISRPSSLACKSPPSDAECGRGERRRRRM